MPFVLMRVFAIIPCVAWYRMHVVNAAWLDNHPRLAYRALLATSLFLATLLYLSTHTLPNDDGPGTHTAHRNFPVPNFTPVSFVQLCAGVVFILVAFSNPIFFVHSLIFVVAALVLVLVPWEKFLNGCTEASAPLQKMVFVLAVALHSYGAWVMEKSERRQFRSQRAMEVSQSRMSSILNTLMPPLVVEELRRNPPTAALPSHRYHRATIAQADLVGFTALCSGLQPSEVVTLISDIFGLFDDLTDLYDVYKIETVGDAYIAGQAETPLTRRNSPLSVALLALDMIKEVKAWSRDHDEVVNCRVGIHTGECVGGIVGSNMQRYHLFGTMMYQVEILESTAPPGEVQASEAFRDAIEAELEDRRARHHEDGVRLEPRHLEPLSTSKGESHSCSEVGGPTYLIKGDST
mmetsp:Transcript_3635/g.9057  ORF Transcript_3635/g.9057 Transcript_3635/m.9057 type:complete len:406 (+) Transcript_3635:1-1218(+)